jgi:hypothetical protein
MTTIDASDLLTVAAGADVPPFASEVAEVDTGVTHFDLCLAGRISGMYPGDHTYGGCSQKWYREILNGSSPVTDRKDRRG